MKDKKFLTANCLKEIVKNMDKRQLRYLQNRITIALQLKIEFVGLYITSQDNYPFFDIHLGTNIDNIKQELHEMLKVIQYRLSASFDNINQIESKKDIQGLLKQNNDNMKIKFEQIQRYVQFACNLFNQYKWNLNDEINMHLIYCYMIDDVDFVTKNELVYPSFWLKLDTFLLPPALVNQNTFFEYLLNINDDEKKKVLKQYNKLSNQLAIYLFEIRDLLQQFAKTKLQIQIFPSQLNFNFIRKDTEKPYYLNHQHFDKFVEQNSRIYSQKYKKTNYFEEYLELNNKIQLNMFRYYPFDEISQGLILVRNNQREENSKELQEYSQCLYKQKYPTKRDVESIQVKAVSLEYLHSLNCVVNSHFEYVQHIIDPETMICKQCKQQIDDYGTLFYDIRFYQFYQSLKDILLSPYYIDIPGVYICPITIKLIGAKNNFIINSEILNQKGQLLLTLYNQKLNFELFEEYDSELENDNEHYEIMNEINERNQEQILQDEEQDVTKLNEK